MYLSVRTISDLDRYMEKIRESARRVRETTLLTGEPLDVLPGEPLDVLRRMKFDQIGFDPIEHQPLNLVEQINQTWTYAVAFAAVRQLLSIHRDAGGYRLAPGAHASIDLDIMS
jgi:hypothetical protein